LGVRLLNWRNKSVASTLNAGNKATARLSIPQCSSQGCDVNAERIFIDEGAGPDSGHQLVLADHFSRTLHERRQNL
jgi:hypothetical protein